MVKILVVDDEKSICSTLKRNFEYIGYEVFTAANAEQALEIFGKESPDVIFLDIHLPDIDGITLLQKMKAINKENTIMIVTAVNDEETKMIALKNGATEYISKPFSREHLRDLVAHHVYLMRKNKFNMTIANILIVDDETDVCESIKSYISKRIKANIDICFDGKQALEQFRKSEYDIVFLDISMPGINGIEVLKEMKKLKTDAGVIIVSAWQNPEVADEALSSGAVEYMQKNEINLDTIFSRIKYVLKSKNKWIEK